MTNSKKLTANKETMIRFITATKELLDSDALSEVSIRKIADKVGLHNSTIYRYFDNADQLILLASLKHFERYSRSLEELSRRDASPVDNFLAIWDFFGETVFQKPYIFHNFFFGQYSDNLTAIMHQYYELFPEERAAYSKDIEEMYFGNSIQERCLRILRPLIGCPGVRVTEENIGLINQISVSCLKTLMEDKCQNPQLDPDLLRRKLTSMVGLLIME